jgi:hypothetical protein
MHRLKTVLIMIALLALGALSFAQKSVNDIQSLLTPETVVLVLGLATPILTSIFKRWFKTEGVATVFANALINAVTKGLLLVVSGQATIGYAVVYVVIGLLIDKGIHSFLKTQDEKVLTQ